MAAAAGEGLVVVDAEDARVNKVTTLWRPSGTPPVNVAAKCVKRTVIQIYIPTLKENVLVFARTGQ